MKGRNVLKQIENAPASKREDQPSLVASEEKLLMGIEGSEDAARKACAACQRKCFRLRCKISSVKRGLRSPKEFQRTLSACSI